MLCCKIVTVQIKSEPPGKACREVKQRRFIESKRSSSEQSPDRRCVRSSQKFQQKQALAYRQVPSKVVPFGAAAGVGRS
jgi:hypothetical protein